MRGLMEYLKSRYGSPGLATYGKWIAFPKRMTLDRKLASSNYRVFQQNRSEADIRVVRRKTIKSTQFGRDADIGT